jgi:hypothetical protein
MGGMTRSRPFSARCSHEITNEVLTHSFELLAETGVRVLQCLGCGQNGCAFRATDSLVLKVSQHEGEAPIARVLAGKGRPWPFLPVFHAAWILDGEFLGYRHNVGVVLREDLIDWKPDHTSDYIAAANEVINSAWRSASDDSSPRALASRLRERNRQVVSEWEDSLTERDMSAVMALADFTVWSAEYGLGFDFEEFRDSLSITNLGESLVDDQIVIRDIGNFDPRSGALRKLARDVKAGRA